ncbi:tetratricopeptide repeat protein [Bowmanella sp. Y26]|uniref:tetratricopeptide repeat protein n=1 Tax=Bowmanella yangjiangensis TaxID=2811230 RepID=UPI001BDC76A9|nr:tetratricopeptide repeat protein [Bowmanella yangjiangensis]MBT1065973.1 tetratricopeptide repeat protein [Bowmanella yangjiangensis]
MSVVNKMLKDLENRQAAPAGLQAEYQPPAPRRSVWWLFGVLPIALLVALAYWLIPQWIQPEKVDVSAQVEPVRLAKPVERVTEKQVEDAKVQAQDTEPQPQPQPQPALAQTLVSEEPQEQQNPTSETATVVKDEVPVAEGKLSISKQASEQDLQWAGLKERAKHALAQNQFESAQKLLTQMLHMQPQQHAVRLRLAELMYGLGQVGGAKQLLQDGLASFQEEPSLRLMLARMLVGEQRQTEALVLLKQHQPSILAYADYFALRAQLAQQAGELPLAVQDYLLLSEYQPQKVEWRMGLAVSQDQQGEVEQAREHYLWLSHSGKLNSSLQSFVVQRLSALEGQ